MRLVRALVGALLGALSLGACSETSPVFSPEPIPLSLAGSTGGLLGIGTAATRAQTFPMLVDTAAPLTAFSDGTTTQHATRGALRLYGNDPDVGEVPRLELPDIQLFVTDFGGTGLDVSSPISGVLGGDNLRRFVAGLTYVPTPALTLTDRLILNDCDASQRCAAVLPFSLAGGRQAIDIGEDIYSYPPSYVLLDACLEPAVDPLEPALACRDRGCVIDCPPALGQDRNTCIANCTKHRNESCGGSCHDCDDACGNVSSDECVACIADSDRYLAHGVNVRLVVATGFPGLALTDAAYDRLRGRGAHILLGKHTLFLPDQPINSSGLSVGVDTLGRPSTGVHDASARSAIALVGRTGYFGACEELARSRRLRSTDPKQVPPNQESCLRSPDRYGTSHDYHPTGDPLLAACASQVSDDDCDDRGNNARVTAYAELQGQIPIIIVPDTTSLLQSINADVRPDSATVEGVIGTELLRRLRTTIDYPNGRMVTTCADADCRVFPQWGHGSDCQIPLGDVVFGGGPVRSVPGGGCALP